jgi:hypothetical protein
MAWLVGGTLYPRPRAGELVHSVQLSTLVRDYAGRGIPMFERVSVGEKTQT